MKRALRRDDDTRSTYICIFPIKQRPQKPCASEDFVIKERTRAMFVYGSWSRRLHVDEAVEVICNHNLRASCE